MKQNYFIEIITERLLLRKLIKADWKMISYLRSDKEVNEFVKRPSAESKEKALEFILKINIEIDNGQLYYWTITEKNNGEMIGSICLWKFSKDKKSAEVGYDLSPKYQKKGIMNESLHNVLEFGFKKLNLDYIEAYTHKNNENSKKLLKRNGFRLVEDKNDVNNIDNIVYKIKKGSSKLAESQQIYL
jgi:ribosomal-protein-alanine N-acetyltransferase